MTITIGDSLPETVLQYMDESGVQSVTPAQIFGGKKAVLFALPGAFTPTCSNQHVPGYLKNHDALLQKGVEVIACVSVNDVFVMNAWGREQNTHNKIMMLADGAAAFANAVGLVLNLVEAGYGIRSQRYSMLLEDAVVKTLNIEQGNGAELSGAEHMLQSL